MKVYIAGPYTQGDVVLNVRNAIAAAEEIVAAGHTPFIPHLSHLWHMVTPHPYEFWLEQDMVWLEACDCLVRLPGESTGADREEAWCRENGVLVYPSMASFLRLA